MPFPFYEKALFYLDIVYGFVGNIHCKMEYINCLVNSKDFRAIYIINKEIQEDLTRAMQLKKEEITKDMVTFHHFLRRRKAYTLVNMGRLDEAE